MAAALEPGARAEAVPEAVLQMRRRFEEWAEEARRREQDPAARVAATAAANRAAWDTGSSRETAETKATAKLREAVVRDDLLMLQEAHREKEECEKDPYVHEGFYYKQHDTVRYSFFRFEVKIPRRNKLSARARRRWPSRTRPA